MTARATTERIARGGRPSKGKRRPLMSRVPEELAEKVMEEAESSGLTYSDWIATVLAEKVGYELPHGSPVVRSTDSIQEELPMATAS